MSFFKQEDKKKFITSKEYTICSKCGASMESNKRYCMKCGALNYDHPDNEYMKKYVSNDEIDKINRDYFDDMHEENKDDDVFVGGKKLKELKIEDKEDVESKNYKAGLVYVLLFSLVLFGGGYFYLKLGLNDSISLSVFIFSMLISILSMCNIYRKAGYSGFTFFIPFYSMYVLCDMLLDKGILFLLSFVPIVNIIFLIYLLYKLGEKFGINGVLSVLFSPIVILYISFSDRVKFLGRGNEKETRLITVCGFLFMCIYLLVILFFFITFINTLRNIIVL